jgi:hypothetical protein
MMMHELTNPKFRHYMSRYYHYGVILSLWCHIVIMVSYYHYGVILSLWCHIIIMVSYYYYGVILSLWCHIIIMVSYYHYGVIVIMVSYYHYGVIFLSAVNNKVQCGVQNKLLFEKILNLNCSKNFFLFLCEYLKTVRIN